MCGCLKYPRRDLQKVLRWLISCYIIVEWCFETDWMVRKTDPQGTIWSPIRTAVPLKLNLTSFPQGCLTARSASECPSRGSMRVQTAQTCQHPRTPAPSQGGTQDGYLKIRFSGRGGATRPRSPPPMHISARVL